MQFAKFLNFVHGMTYASLILVSSFAYGLYTAQVRGSIAKPQVIAAYDEQDYISAIQNGGR